MYDDKCKYVAPESFIVYNMIELIYDILEQQTGGLAHVVSDDNNLSDEILKSVIEDCYKEENKDRPEVLATKTLCEALLKLTLNQRYFIFAFIENDYTSIDELKSLFTYCYFDGCCTECIHKTRLNLFHANEQCIKETGNNLKFLDGEWPIEDVMGV